MKKFIKPFTIIAVSFFMLNLSAQQKGFNYQAIARDANGTPLSGITLQVQIGIVDAEAGGLMIWQEQHQNVNTNNSGSFNLVIGDPEAEKIGGTAPFFNDINWAVGNYELNFRVNAGDGFIDLGYAPLNAVPYAKVTENITHPLPQFTIQNNGDIPPGEALFEVRRADGRPVFAVFEDSVWVYTDTAGSKSVKGGFAVGGYRKTSKGEVVEEYMRVTPGSVRINIDNTPGKGVKGGFAVGGYRKTAKGDDLQYLSINSDSVRIYSGYTPAKGAKGGFGLYGIDYKTGAKVTYMSMTPDNYFIGQGAGVQNTTGSDNIFLGTFSGRDNEVGSNNIFLGTGSGQKNRGGSGNVFLGYNSGNAVEGNNLLVIENSAKDNTGAMFFGDFDQDILRINANMGIMVEPDPAYSIKTEGTILANDVPLPSDVRYKSNIETLDDAIDLIMNLRGVSFDWNQSAFPEKNFSDGRQIGFIAQEMEKIFPEFVSTGGDGYKAVSYQKMTAVLVEAVKEQQQMISSRDAKIAELEQRLERIEGLIGK